MHHLDDNGVKLVYEEHGRGDPPLLLVHGALCDRRHFAAQIRHFRHNHRIIAVDLPGHGQSEKPQQEYSVAGFAETLARLCEHLQINRPVVVGHSMGGAIALELAARRPKLPAAIVLLDTAVITPAAVIDAVPGLVAGCRSFAYPELVRQFFGAFFAPADDQERKAGILSEMAATPAHVAAAIFEELGRYDGVAAAAACRVPTLYIGSGALAWDVARFRALCPQAMIGQTIGAGHFHQIEVPEQVNAMIERFLAVTVARSGSAPERP